MTLPCHKHAVTREDIVIPAKWEIINYYEKKNINIGRIFKEFLQMHFQCVSFSGLINQQILINRNENYIH